MKLLSKIKDNYEIVAIFIIGALLAIAGDPIGFLMAGIAVGAVIYLRARQ